MKSVRTPNGRILRPVGQESSRSCRLNRRLRRCSQMTADYGYADQRNRAHGAPRHAVPVLSGVYLCRGDAGVAQFVKAPTSVDCPPRMGDTGNTEWGHADFGRMTTFFHPWVNNIRNRKTDCPGTDGREMRTVLRLVQMCKACPDTNCKGCPDTVHTRGAPLRGACPNVLPIDVFHRRPRFKRHHHGAHKGRPYGCPIPMFFTSCQWSLTIAPIAAGPVGMPSVVVYPVFFVLGQVPRWIFRVGRLNCRLRRCSQKTADCGYADQWNHAHGNAQARRTCLVGGLSV